MALGPRLDLRQSQSLVMTPKLQLAIRLLALSNQEVDSFVAEELARNPLLETAGRDEADSASEEDAPAAPETVDLPDSLASADGDTPLDIDYDSEDFHQDSVADAMRVPDAGSGQGPGGGEGADLDSFASRETSLQEHLLTQAGAALSGSDLMIASEIIGQLEETGYLQTPLTEVAEKLGARLADTERVLGIVQGFDPPGIAARSLAECLVLQAKEANRYDPAMARLIDNLDYLAKGNLAALRRICGVDDDDLHDMIRELRAYDPKPGCQFLNNMGAAAQAITPDVFVRRSGMGWSIELNSATLPSVLINRDYQTELSRGARDNKSRAWLSECVTNASWLIKALDQRARTIVKVTSEIVKRQDAFFREGVAQLRPLTLRVVADAIGMHESTISRVTSNKYLACERGLFELKYFFTSAIQSTDGGDALSAAAVKSRIKALTGAEKPDAVLSDDQLVDFLRKDGFDIARRTVAKYREALGIGSSVQRRRQHILGKK